MLETNSCHTETSPCSYQYTSTFDSFTPPSHFPNLYNDTKNSRGRETSNLSNPYDVKDNLKTYLQTEEECNYKILNPRKISWTECSHHDGRYDYTPGDTWYGKEDDFYSKHKLQYSLGKKPKTAEKNKKRVVNGIQDYGKTKKEEAQTCHPFLTNILRELRRQSKANYTRIVGKKTPKQPKEFDFGSPQIKVRTRGFSNTNSPNIDLFPRESGDNSFTLSPQPFAKKGRKLKSANINAPKKRSMTPNIPRSRLDSEGRCVIPQSITSEVYDTCYTTATGYSEAIKTEATPLPKRNRKNSSLTSESQSSHVHSRRRDSQVTKVDDKFLKEDKKYVLNASSYNSEKNSPDLGPFLTDIKEEGRGKRLYKTQFNPYNGVNQTYYLSPDSNHNKFNHTIGRFNHQSPEERQAELKKRRHQHLKQEKERAKFEMEDRKKRIQVLLKSRIITKFDKIKERLNAIRELKERNNRSYDDLQKH